MQFFEQQAFEFVITELIKRLFGGGIFLVSDFSDQIYIQHIIQTYDLVPGAFMPQFVQSGIDHDPVQPGREGGLAAEIR